MRLATSLSLFLFGTLMMPWSAVLAQPLIGNAEAGRRFAEIWCSGCHAVELRTTRSGGIAPDLPSIANRATSRSLKSFLRKRHEKMPNFVLDKEDTDDVVAYILSLKRK